ncbi:aminotransferase class I/II-fold pyridoxal phosphate-dependent enzyme [Mariprofundus erugo]|uniref:aminotransferase class I/II-fold pyridoxal phosphate-dependent enzyme n=1 Tax=Mariprofundus erugo TaxID=2528639 RepID=UPI0010FD1AF7|nr:aminotransferase class I/II-fold pyridoxal phosphate-dependent enzyme [Mariprofundus erugo]TLS77342.1 aminotransferase class I/II-fold pyridoxal phosphate-dependent enzyme [Mariprofundus erugo]
MSHGNQTQQTRLEQLGAYPFARLKSLLAGHAPKQGLAHIDAGAGEPRLPLPAFVAETVATNLGGLSRYPSTSGNDVLREAIAAWLMRRYGLPQIDAATQVLSANGTREALFAIAHALINPEADIKPWAMMPNPMYQIYLGAAITAGAHPYFMPCTAANGFEPDLDAIPADVWANTALVYVCSPSNPTGWVADHNYFTRLLALADEHDFYIVSDECYSEIYWHEKPVGLLQVAAALGRNDYARCLVMNSLSKRSALPGMRSGLIAGDAALISRFAKLRSYTGPATPLPLQHVAAAAWSDETHVEQHLAIYRQSLQAFFDNYGKGQPPAGSFFIWLPVENDEAFAIAAYEQQAITLLPGSYLSADDHTGSNPGAGYVRVALVDGPDKAAELGRRLRAVSI